MGHDLATCYKCHKVLPEADFQVGEAFRVGTLSACTNCLPELLAKLTPEQKYKVLADQDAITAAKKEEEEDAAIEAKAAPQTRKKKPPSTVRRRSPFNTTASIRTLREPPPAPAKTSVIPYVVVAGGIIALILLAIGLFGGSSTTTPAPEPSPKKSATTRKKATSTPRLSAAQAALKKARDAERARPGNRATLSDLFDKAVTAARGTSVESEALRARSAMEDRFRSALTGEIAALEKEIHALAEARTLQKGLDRLAEVRSHHAAPAWANAITRLEREINDSAAGNFLRMKAAAVEAQRLGKAGEVETCRRKIETWGIHRYIDALDKALAAALPPAVPGVEVKSLTLLDHRGEAIRGFDPLKDNVLIDLSEMTSTRFEVRANTANGVGSVIFGYNGDTRYQVESGSPYELTGGNRRLELSPGSHTIIATPYSANNGKGKAGRPLRIRLQVVQ